MRLSVLALCVAAAFVGCTRPNPASCEDDHCADPELPFCDTDGAIGGEPNTCIAVSCTAGEFEACRGDRALMCSATGDNYDLVECEFGCNPIAGCNTCNTTDCEKHIIPKYLPTVCSQLASNASLTISSNTMLDTSDASACSSIVAQPTGPDICVLHYGTINIERNQTYTVIGSRAVALIADYALVVDGVLDLSASSSTSGPGGGRELSGTTMGSAGGGAGYRTAGGSGGINADGDAGNGGPTAANPSSLAELFGGKRAAPGAGNALPGGGGGAATLISCRATTSVVGVIDAGGGGGEGGYLYMTTAYYPAGGGSGGTVVLQGAQVTVTGEIYANGGGGGGGFASKTNGQDALRSTTQALGGSGEGTLSTVGAGGAGGALLQARHGAKCPPDGGACGGAGGGSAGYILIYVPQSNNAVIAPVSVSPEIDPAGIVATN